MMAPDLAPVSSPVLRVGHFSRALLVYSCQAPKSVCPFRPPAPPKPIPRCLEQHRSVILHDSCDPEWSQRPHFLDSLKPHADVGLIDEKSGLVVIEAHSPATELLPKNPILLPKVVNDQQLALVHPPGNGDQREPEWVEESLRIQRKVHYRDRRAAIRNHRRFI